MRVKESSFLKANDIPRDVLDKWSDDILIYDLSSHRPTEAPSKVIAVCPDMTLEKMIEIMHATGIRHIIQKKAENFVSEIETAASFIERNQLFMKSPEKIIFGGEIREAYSGTFNSYAEKTKILAEAEHYLKILPRTDSIQQNALTIVDELFTNALLNAPPEGSQVTRKNLTQYKGEKTSKLFLFSDYFRLLVGCRDLYGTLNIKNLLDMIFETYILGKGKAIRRDPLTGAGIGFRMIIDSSISIYVAVVPNVETVVCCSLPLRQSSKSLLQLGRSIHLS